MQIGAAVQPWEIYLAELRQRAERVPDHAFGRAEILAEAAHDAYQTTANRLTNEGMGEEEALIVTRMFGQAVKEWLSRNGSDWDSLGLELNRRYSDWSATR